MFERIAWALAVIGAGMALYLLLGRAHIAWVRRRAPRSAPTGRPTLLYFSTPGCAPCWSLQAPAVTQVEDDLGEAIRVVRVDALLEPEVANRWGVLSVPTTVILDRAGQLRHFNHGFVTADVLKRQIAESDGGRQTTDGRRQTTGLQPSVVGRRTSFMGGRNDRIREDI